MEELLKRWAESAPDECKVRDMFGVDRWSLVGMGANYESPFEGTVILATMQAIEARGFTWQLQRPSIESMGPYRANIYWQDGATQTLVGKGKSPAYALLSAYIKALDEVK